jgi:hypothetical protein
MATVIGVKRIGKSGLIQATLKGSASYNGTTGEVAMLPCAAIDSIVGQDNSAGYLVIPRHGNAPDAKPNELSLTLFRWNPADGGYWEVVPNATDLTGVFFIVTYTRGPAQQPYEAPL